jgi:hypothetical protein
MAANLETSFRPARHAARALCVGLQVHSTNKRNDLIKKKRSYHRHDVGDDAIPHYWLVDPRDAPLTVMRTCFAGLVLRQGEVCFVVTNDDLRTLDGDVHALGEEDVIVAHPVKLGDAEREAARTALGQLELAPAFAQIDRPIVRATRASIEALVAEKRPKIPDLLERFFARGYVLGEYMPDANAVMDCVRHVGPSVVIEIGHDGATRNDPQTIELIRWSSSFDDDDPGLLSEIALDLELLTARGPEPSSRDEKPRGPNAGGSVALPPGYPSAEIAPSGRAKCLQSGATIPKGTTRIIVLREIDTPSFRGTTNGYLLPQHAKAWAEANGHPWNDFVGRLRANADHDADCRCFPSEGRSA